MKTNSSTSPISNMKQTKKISSTQSVDKAASQGEK